MWCMSTGRRMKPVVHLCCDEEVGWQTSKGSFSNDKTIPCFPFWYRNIQKDLAWCFLFFPLVTLFYNCQIELSVWWYWTLQCFKYSQYQKSVFSVTEKSSGKQIYKTYGWSIFPFLVGWRKEGKERSFINYWWSLRTEICCPYWVTARTAAMHVTPAELCSVGVKTWCSFSVNVAVIF